MSLNISPFLPPTHTPRKTTHSKKRSKRRKKRTSSRLLCLARVLEFPAGDMVDKGESLPELEKEDLSPRAAHRQRKRQLTRSPTHLPGTQA